MKSRLKSLFVATLFFLYCVVAHAQSSGLSISTFENLGISGIRSNWIPIEGRLYVNDLQKFKLVVKNHGASPTQNVLLQVYLINKVKGDSSLLHSNLLPIIAAHDSLLLKQGKDLTSTSTIKPVDFGNYDNDSTSFNVAISTQDTGALTVKVRLLNSDNFQVISEKVINFLEQVYPYTDYSNIGGFIKDSIIEIMPGQDFNQVMKVKDIGTNMRHYHPFDFTGFTSRVYLSKDSLIDDLDTGITGPPYFYLNNFFSITGYNDGGRPGKAHYNGREVETSFYTTFPDTLPIGKEYYVITMFNQLDGATVDPKKHMSYYKVKTVRPKVDIKLLIDNFYLSDHVLNFNSVAEAIKGVVPDSVLRYEMYISDDTLIGSNDRRIQTGTFPPYPTNASTTFIRSSIHLQDYDTINATKNIIFKIITTGSFEEVNPSNQIVHFKVPFGNAPVNNALTIISYTFDQHGISMDVNHKVENLDSVFSYSTLYAYYSKDSLFSQDDVPYIQYAPSGLVQTRIYVDPLYFITTSTGLSEINPPIHQYLLLVLKNDLGIDPDQTNNVGVIRLRDFPVGLTNHRLENSGLKMHPNPSNGKLSLQGIEGSTSLDVIGMDQTVVYTSSISSGTNVDLDISHLPKGVYFVRINGSVPRLGKLIIQ